MCFIKLIIDLQKHSLQYFYKGRVILAKVIYNYKYLGSGSDLPCFFRSPAKIPIGLYISHSSLISLPINCVNRKSCTNNSALASFCKRQK